MGDNFPAVWLCLDGRCCRRCGRTGLSSIVVAQRETQRIKFWCPTVGSRVY